MWIITNVLVHVLRLNSWELFIEFPLGFGKSILAIVNLGARGNLILLGF